MAGKNKEYADKYAEYAMEQMRRYGIPASVTLAQGILESSNGQSELARKENNHFGIKATQSWIAEGGRYSLYSDDKPNEKFCSYDNVGDSYEHHSRFLKENSRYAECFNLRPDDYKGWTEGIAKAGYATGGNYAGTLAEDHRAERPGQIRPSGHAGNGRAGQAVRSGKQSSPGERKGRSLFISGGTQGISLCHFRFRNASGPDGQEKQQMHKGLDIRCKGDAVLATENGGKVVSVNGNANSAGGKSVTVEYSRPDGSKVQCTYMHLGDIAVKAGDSVKAGQRLGTSGNTGTRTTGEHLHFGVVNIHSDGTRRDIDPAAYLAEIAQKGNIKQQVLYNGNDLLAKYRSTEEPKIEKPLSTEDWMKKLLSSEDSGVGMSGCNDPVMEMAMTAFTSLMVLAVQIDSKNEEEQKAAVSGAMDSGKIDLKPLLPDMKSCSLTMKENGKAVLQADNGEQHISRELSSAELSRLSAVLNNSSLTDEAKRMRVTGLLNTAILSEMLHRISNRACPSSEDKRKI